MKLTVENQKKLINVISIFLIALFVIVALDIAQKNKTDNPANDAKNESKIFSQWRDYNNEKYGLQISYPSDRYIVQEDDNKAEISPACGETLWRAFLMDKADNLNAGELAIYQNLQNTAPEDFFICRKTEAKKNFFDRSEIREIKTPKEYGVNNQALRFILSGNMESLIIVADDITYEIRNMGNIAATIFDQIIDSVKLTERRFEDIDALDEFCAQNAARNNQAMTAAITIPINANEEFIGCALRPDSNLGEWNRSQPLEIFHVAKDNNGYSVLWQGGIAIRASNNNFIDWQYVMDIVSAGDINQDGFTEILLSGKGSGACPEKCAEWCLYSPGNKDLICMTSFTRSKEENITIDRLRCVTDVDETCEKDCDILVRTLCFNEKIDIPEYAVFKNYLEQYALPGI